MAGINRNAQMVEDGFSLAIDFVKVIIFFVQFLTKILPFWIAMDLIDPSLSLSNYYLKDVAESLFGSADFQMRYLLNPIFLFLFFWSLCHLSDDKFGGKVFYLSSIGSVLMCSLYIELSSKSPWHSWLFVIPWGTLSIIHIWGSIVALKTLAISVKRVLITIAIVYPMKAIGYVSPSLYTFMVKKIWYRLDVLYRFHEKPIYVAKGAVDPRDGKTFYQSSEWRKLRYQAFEKYGTICLDPHCNNPATHVDHVKPRSLRPDLALDINNLQVLCEDCNKIKSNKSEVDFRTVKKK